MDLHILFLEPFYGGSHKDFADGLTASSKHSVDMHTLPARFWKWRMRGASLYFAHQIPDPSGYDLVFTSDMLSVADLKGLWGKKAPPVIVYFHESQLSYPYPGGQERDYHFCFTDITNCMAADKVIFNSNFHKKSFFHELPLFLSKMPEYKPLWAVDQIAAKADVLYPGCSFPGETRSADASDGTVIIWNHRWEFDKQPEVFFNALYQADARCDDFHIILAGENFQMVPKPFLEAKEYFKDRILQYGFVQDKTEYQKLLSRGDIIISTAIQENFGISIVEGIHAGCYPILPNRLSYPEIIPEQYHPACLYNSDRELTDLLLKVMQERIPPPRGIKKEMEKFSWKHQIEAYDHLFEQTVLCGSPMPKNYRKSTNR